MVLKLLERSIKMAFNELNLHSVVAQLIPNNIASKKVVEKIGMQYKFNYMRLQNGNNREHLVYEIKN